MIIQLNVIGGGSIVVWRDRIECDECFNLRLESILTELPDSLFFSC